MFQNNKLNTIEEEGFSKVCWMPGDNSINCVLDENHTIVVKRMKNRTSVLLYKGKKYISLPIEAFETVCDLKVSVQYLSAFLEGQPL